MKKYIKVSVIVSAFNEEKRLDRCVESLLKQSLHEIEIILVDDASTDKTLDIMRDYEQHCPQKIGVIHSDINLRQGGGRNLGIEAAKGDYIAFVDCDDWVERSMFETLYNEAKKTDSDICYCLRRQVYENGKIKADNTACFLPTGVITETVRRDMLAQHNTFIQRCIYRRSLFMEQNIRFPAHLRYEDMVIDPLIIPHVNRIAAVNKPLYNYFIHTDSTTTEKNENKYKDKLAVCRIIIDEYRQRGFYDRYKDEINYLYFRKGYIHTALNYILNVETISRDVIRDLKKNMLAVDKNYRRNPYYNSRKAFVVIDRLLDSKTGTKALKKLLNIIGYNV